MGRWAQKALVAAPWGLITLMVLKCPCEKLLQCNWPTAVGLGVVGIVLAWASVQGWLLKF